MSHVPHELAEEFPEAHDKLHELKTGNTHVSGLMDKYHDVNRQIHRIETNVEPADEGFEKQLRRQRLALKDEIATYL